MLEWIILGAILGGAAVAFWDEIKKWVRNMAYKVKAYSKMFIQKISGSSYKVMIEGETRIISASEVPEDIRKRASYSYQTDITTEAKRAGILQL